MYFNQCPRCGDTCYETLSTHSYCLGCDYHPDIGYDFTRWHQLEFRKLKNSSQRKMEESLSMGGLCMKGVL